jgi:hypothetical protein
VLQTGCDNCTGPEQLCDLVFCKDVNCRTTSDCPAGDNCTLQLGRPLFGECRQAHGGICGVDEFAVDALDPDHPFCLIYQACWSQAACAAPYSCISSYDLMMPMIGDPGFCARQL